MKIKSTLKNQNNEIDLIQFSKIIWKEKIKVFLITIIIFSIFTFYNYKLENSKTQKLYLNSMSIKLSDDLDRSGLRYLYILVNDHSKFNDTQVDGAIYNFDPDIKDFLSKKLLAEITDYNEFYSVLFKSNIIENDFSKISDQELLGLKMNYAKLIKIEKLLNDLEPNSNEYLISLQWHDPKQAQDLLNKTIELVLVNLNKSIYESLYSSLNTYKLLRSTRDKRRLEFLKEQNFIAKDLGIKDYSANFFINNDAYYLSGYKAIEKEIEIIENRTYQEDLDIKKKLTTFKNSQNKLITYNKYFFDSELLTKPSYKLSMPFSLLLGLIVGIFYVFIFNRSFFK